MPPSNPAAATAPTGWARYEEAKALIPGGTQLLSKRPEMFLPGGWPCYFSRAKGCRTWDLDDRAYTDMATNGIGACLLGFADEAVDAAVKAAIDRGSMCSLNDPAELTLARMLTDLHPWANRVRYARTGGEVMAVAVRIARAATGRDKVLFCGYHGWHDWYLAANLAEDEALDGHLLPGLAPRGVPRALRHTALPFRYGQLDELRALLAQHGRDTAAIVMEPLRYERPPDGFLEQVRALADEHGVVLVFDEITAGWRHHLGGAHMRLGVEPDVAVFAKSLSNGYPMAAVVGRDAVMDAAQETFISSTYWTESVGFAAAIATLECMRKIDLPARLADAGQRIRDGWQRLIDRHGLPMHVSGLPALLHLGIDLDDARKTKALGTLLTQAMLDRGYLANTSFYATAAHTEDVISGYLDALDETFAELRDAIDHDDVEARLRGPVAQSGFQRLT